MKWSRSRLAVQFNCRSVDFIAINLLLGIYLERDSTRFYGGPVMTQMDDLFVRPEDPLILW